MTPEPRRTDRARAAAGDDRTHRLSASDSGRPMFGVDTSELLLVAVLALIFIGPKDLPMRFGRSAAGSARSAAWRAISTSGIDAMIREAELEEMEKKWREENERIMREYPRAPRCRPRRDPDAARLAARASAATSIAAGEAGAAVRDIDDTKAPLLEHLIELRKRLLLVAGRSLVALFFICLYFAKTIFAFLVQPLLAAGQGKLIYTDIFEAFFVEVKVALFAALMIGFPFFATQMWRFVAPGLYAKEKKALLPFLLLTPFFFIGGAAFAYFVAMPWALQFLLSFQGDVGGVQRKRCRASATI